MCRGSELRRLRVLCDERLRRLVSRKFRNRWRRQFKRLRKIQKRIFSFVQIYVKSKNCWVCKHRIWQWTYQKKKKMNQFFNSANLSEIPSTSKNEKNQFLYPENLQKSPLKFKTSTLHFSVDFIESKNPNPKSTSRLSY